MLQKLKVEIGVQAMFKLTTMFTDIASSKELDKNFQEKGALKSADKIDTFVV